MKLSIVIVCYKAKERLFGCINSIQKSKPKTKYEIILVDNNEKDLIKSEVKKKFPFVQYVKSKENKGSTFYFSLPIIS